MRRAVSLGAAIGAVVGVLLPLGIAFWTLVVETLPGPRHEALWLVLTRIRAAAYPIAWAIEVVAAPLQESRAGWLLYMLLMLAVVLNWTFLGAAAGSTVGFINLLRRRRETEASVVSH